MKLSTTYTFIKYDMTYKADEDTVIQTVKQHLRHYFRNFRENIDKDPVKILKRYIKAHIVIWFAEVLKGIVNREMKIVSRRQRDIRDAIQIYTNCIGSHW